MSRVEATDASLDEQLRDRLLTHAGGVLRRGHQFPEAQKPVVRDVVGESQNLRVVP